MARLSWGKPRPRLPLPGQLALELLFEPEPDEVALSPPLWSDSDIPVVKRQLLNRSLRYLRQERVGVLEKAEILYWISMPPREEVADALSFQDCAVAAGFNPVPLAWGVIRTCYRFHARLRRSAQSQHRKQVARMLRDDRTVISGRPLDNPLAQPVFGPSAKAARHAWLMDRCRKAMDRLPDEFTGVYETAQTLQ